MAILVAIGYPDETTATAAAEEAHRLAKDLIIQPDAIAAIQRDAEGKFHVHTSHGGRPGAQPGGCSGACSSGCSSSFPSSAWRSAPASAL
jgi:uncharacterized membrane protein